MGEKITTVEEFRDMAVAAGCCTFYQARYWPDREHHVISARVDVGGDSGYHTITVKGGVDLGTVLVEAAADLRRWQKGGDHG